MRFEWPQREEEYEAGYEQEDERPYGQGDYVDRRCYHHKRGRGHQGRKYEENHYEERRGNQTNNWGPKRPKIYIPKFGGGDPYKWKNKVDNYFHSYEVPRQERVLMACFYLEGKASKWWRWIHDQYEKERRRLGWMALEKEFSMQFGPSPIVNHHGQLAKLKQEGKVHTYVEDFQ